jgi:hypothetical protein
VASRPAGRLGDDLWIEPEAYYDVGEHTVTFHVLHGRGLQSGADVAMSAAHVCRWHDSLIVYFRGYSRRQDALSDLGAAESPPDPIAP